jgi:hypothetical protein
VTILFSSVADILTQQYNKTDRNSSSILVFGYRLLSRIMYVKEARGCYRYVHTVHADHARITFF